MTLDSNWNVGDIKPICLHIIRIASSLFLDTYFMGQWCTCTMMEDKVFQRQSASQSEKSILDAVSYGFQQRASLKIGCSPPDSYNILLGFGQPAYLLANLAPYSSSLIIYVSAKWEHLYIDFFQ